MDVVKSLKPIFVALQVFGILPCKIEKTKNLLVIAESEKHTKYVKIVFVTFVTADLILFPAYLIYTRFRPLLHSSSKILVVLGIFAFNFNVTLLFCLVLKNTKFMQVWINKVNVLCVYRLPRVKCKILVRVVTLLVVVSLFNLSILFYAEAVHYTDVNRPTVERVKRFISFLGLLFTDFSTKLFLIFTLIIRLYYEHVNEIIVNLKEENPENNFFLRMIKGLILEDMFIKDLLEFLHRVFIPPITIHLFWSFTLLLYTILCTGREDVWLALQIIWYAYICLETFSIIIICQITINEAERTPHCLHQLFVGDIDAPLKEEIEIFSLQIQHQKIEFSGCGIFKIDCPLLYSAVGAVATYIVILFQFQTNSKSISVCNCNWSNTTLH